MKRTAGKAKIIKIMLMINKSRFYEGFVVYLANDNPIIETTKASITDKNNRYKKKYL